QLLGLLSQLVEKPDVFDGDHGLVGESLEHRDLLLGERPDLRTPDDNAAQRNVPAQQGNRYDGPRAPLLLEWLATRALVIDHRRQIGDVDHPTRGDRAPDDRSGRNRARSEEHTSELQSPD